MANSPVCQSKCYSYRVKLYILARSYVCFGSADLVDPPHHIHRVGDR